MTADIDYVEPLLLFLIGLPLAFSADRLVMILTDWEDDDEEEEEPSAFKLTRKPLPWQEGLWPARTRKAIVALIPPLMALAGWRFDLVQASVASVFLIAMVICIATDLLRYRVPDVITFPGILVMLIAALVLPGASPGGALLAAILAGLGFLVFWWLLPGGLGLGDAKIAALIGAALGLQGAYYALSLGIVLGGLVLLLFFALKMVGLRQGVPYAPFLALGGITIVFVQGAAFAPL